MLCADGDALLSHEKVSLNRQSEPHHDNDICSPLCACSCCGCQGFSLNSTYSFIALPVTAIFEKKVPEYKSILTSNFFGSIWQPPKIS